MVSNLVAKVISNLSVTGNANSTPKDVLFLSPPPAIVEPDLNVTSPKPSLLSLGVSL